MTIADRIQQIQKERTQLEQQLEFLTKLPADLPVELAYQFRGEWHVTLSGSAAAALEALPPSNAAVRLVDGCWQATPENRPLDWSQRILAIIGDKNGLSWYHYLPCATLVRVHVKSRLPQMPVGYELAPSVHNYVFVRQLAPLAQPLQENPESNWTAVWDAFFTQEGYNEKQKMFARILRHLSKTSQEVSFGMLPIPAAGTLKVGDGELVVMTAGTVGCTETLPEDSPFHAFRRIGNFWNSFTRAQAERLIEFANSMRTDLKQTEEDAVKVGLAQAVQAVAQFQDTYLQTVANAPDAAVLTRWVQEKTGYPVQVSIRGEINGCRYNGVYRLWIYLWRWNESAQITLPQTYQPQGFDWQNPPFYQYEPNAGKFAEAITA
jgi:hypothetical protein